MFLNKVSLVCLSSLFFSSLTFSTETPECIYVPPTQPIISNTFFQEIISRGHTPAETFASIRTFFEQHQTSYHQFQIKHPLKNQDQAQLFTKVLQIKAQEAHRFVPVIELSQFIEPSHLGFIRQIKIEGNGPIVNEHILMDPSSNAVIFIEESVTTQNGNEPGCFTALNEIIEESGQWFFAGSYLYDSAPEDASKRIEMFKKTFENMVIFSESEDVDRIFNQLNPF